MVGQEQRKQEVAGTGREQGDDSSGGSCRSLPGEQEAKQAALSWDSHAQSTQSCFPQHQGLVVAELEDPGPCLPWHSQEAVSTHRFFPFFPPWAPEDNCSGTVQEGDVSLAWYFVDSVRHLQGLGSGWPEPPVSLCGTGLTLSSLTHCFFSFQKDMRRRSANTRLGQR